MLKFIMQIKRYITKTRTAVTIATVMIHAYSNLFLTRQTPKLVDESK